MTEDDGIDWAEVARADRAERGECWYRLDTRSPLDPDGAWWCEVHEDWERPGPR